MGGLLTEDISQPMSEQMEESVSWAACCAVLRCGQVTINLRECIVEDFQPDAATGGEKKSTQKLGNEAGSVSLLIRVMHKASVPGAMPRS